MSGSNERSPYKEIGIPGNAAWRQEKQRRMKATSPDQRGIVMGHYWDPNYRWKSSQEHCKLCGQARFLVESQPCKGGRRRL